MAPKTALATLAAVGLFLPFGAPLPGSCLRSIGVAGAAPSPTCASDLRECLRSSADMHQTTFGGRYVTADDVARCTDAFNACISGGASRGGNQSGGGAIPPGSTPEAGGPTPTDSSSDSRGGNASPPKSTAGGGDGREGLPQHFGITVSSNLDCRVNGNAVKCTGNPGHPDAQVQMDELTGTLSGLTLTGTWTRHMELPDDRGSSCPILVDHSAPVSITFSLDGTAAVSEGPVEVSVASGCREPAVNTVPAEQYTQTWSALP